MSQTPGVARTCSSTCSTRAASPSDYRMQGFGVNIVQVGERRGRPGAGQSTAWMPKQGVRSMTEEDAANMRRGPRPRHEGPVRGGRAR
ncbi:hypothetical protein [Streptomyces somaliensis]|uniref:hypothetical protein n=1 Tax=Streptomyces somaliensis TaxID=78355 RepID=UPI0034E93FA7